MYLITLIKKTKHNNDLYLMKHYHFEKKKKKPEGEKDKNCHIFLAVNFHSNVVLMK